MRRSPLSSPWRRRTRGWRPAKAKALHWKLPTSAFAPPPKTRRKAPPPSLKNVHRSSAVGEAARTRRFGKDSHGKRQHFFWTKSGGSGELYRRPERRGDPVGLRRRRHQSGAAER